MLNPKTRFYFCSDSAHGWLKVPKDILQELNFIPTAHSYFDSEHAYLEEDCDAFAFKIAWESITNTPLPLDVFDYEDHGINSPIRNKSRFDGVGANYKNLFEMKKRK